MRPKKVILLVDADATRLGIRTFLLATNGYRVVTAASAQHALEILDQARPGALDLMICQLEVAAHGQETQRVGLHGNELMRRAKQMYPGLRGLIYSVREASFSGALCAEAFLPRGSASHAELLERVRVLLVRKPGPQKKPPVAVTAEDAAAGRRSA